MNENVDLTKILKNCPKGTIFWSDVYGETRFRCVDTTIEHPIKTERADGITAYYTKEGWWSKDFPASCLLWPSKDCRDWSKFTAPWIKKERFNTKALQPFDRVIVRLDNMCQWRCDFFSNVYKYNGAIHYLCTSGNCYMQCTPYNVETQHLVGTTEEAPDYYRCWED